MNEKIEKAVADEIGLDVRTISQSAFKSNIARVVEKYSSTGDLNRYDFDELPEDIRKELIQAAAFPETWFFRGKETFETLKIEAIRALAKKDKLKILSAPCSTGEEPYSIVASLVGAGVNPEKFEIDAVDVDSASLEIARNGAYSENSFREGQPPNFFDRKEQKYYVPGNYIEKVNFFSANVLKPDFLLGKRYEIVFCRNLLIYLTTQARKALLANLERLLSPNGVLFVGHSEASFFIANGYRLTNDRAAFALKIPAEPEPAAPEGSETPPIFERIADAEFDPDLVAAVPDKYFAEEAPDTKVEKKTEKALAKAKNLANKGKYDEAEKSLEKAFGGDWDEEAYLLLGLINSAKNEKDEALEQFQKVLYLNPKNETALFQAAMIYDARGDKEKTALYKKRLEKAAES